MRNYNYHSCTSTYIQIKNLVKIYNLPSGSKALLTTNEGSEIGLVINGSTVHQISKVFPSSGGFKDWNTLIQVNKHPIMITDP